MLLANVNINIKGGLQRGKDICTSTNNMVTIRAHPRSTYFLMRPFFPIFILNGKLYIHICIWYVIAVMVKKAAGKIKMVENKEPVWEHVLSRERLEAALKWHKENYEQIKR